MARCAYYATNTIDGRPRIVRACKDGGYYDHGGGAGVFDGVPMEVLEERAAKLNADAGVSTEEAQRIVTLSLFPNANV